jgi:cytochrome P450
MISQDKGEPGHALRFPLGAAVSLAALEGDPYPIFEALRAREPVSWLPALGMWYATRHAEVRAILLDAQRFTTGWETSTIFDTFGRQMLTTEGAEHDRYRMAAVQAFMPRNIRERLEPAMEQAAAGLVAGFMGAGEADLRAVFASRLPVQTILLTFGMPLSGEGLMRRWYDSFERALANFEGDEAIRRQAHADVAEFHAYLDEAMRETRRTGGRDGLLAALVNAPPGERLSDEEIRRNMSIIFFGGISTVEALLLNSLWALFDEPGLLSRVRADLALLPRVVDETMRWLSPVQSATRHVVEDVEVAGVTLRRGEVINCMLGAANRDPAVFGSPDRFDIDRSELSQHLGFAVGPHMCLGFRLAKAQARIGLTHLLTTLPDLRRDESRSDPPSGYEFRQPRRLAATWRP